jgi:hypothetical protein
MPNQPINYANTIIYKIICNDVNINDCYVGHTTDFIRRKYKHRENCNNENNPKYNFKIYQIIRENGGWDNWTMLEMEKYNCNDKNEAKIRERFWYELLQPKLNTIIPIKTDSENKEYQNIYRGLHKEDNKEYQKVYQLENKDQIKQQRKDFFQKNKNTILELITCECGKNYTKCHYKRHCNSNRHQEYLKSLNNS